MSDYIDRAKILAACLRLAGLSQEEFAKSIGVTQRFPMKVATGEKTSKRVSREIDLFISKHIGLLKDHTDSYTEKAA